MSDFLKILNQHREKLGLQPLVISPTLNKAAQWMANDMATHNYLSHTDSLGRNPFQRMDAFGYNYKTARGENIAAGSKDPQVTYTQWYNACDKDANGKCTYAHRKNMLNPDFKAIGIGMASNPNSNYNYYWVTDFGGLVDKSSTQSPTIHNQTKTPMTTPQNPTQSPTMTPTIANPTSSKPQILPEPLPQPAHQAVPQGNQRNQGNQGNQSVTQTNVNPNSGLHILTDAPNYYRGNPNFIFLEKENTSYSIWSIIFILLLIALVGIFIFSQV